MGAACPRNTREVELSEAVTFSSEKNGSGKSTLLEAIAVNWGFNAEGGSVDFNFSTAETHADFYKGIVLEKSALLPEDGYFLRAESFYNVASQVEKLELNLEGYGANPCTPSPMAKAFYRWRSAGSADGGCISWTSRRRPCRRLGNYPYYIGCTSWCRAAPRC